MTDNNHIRVKAGKQTEKMANANKTQAFYDVYDYMCEWPSFP